MSVLLLEPDELTGTAIVEHLVAEGDDVRVLVADIGGWKALGAFVATGDVMDPDLVQRACTNVRTIVFAFGDNKPRMSTLLSAIPPARDAGADRVVVCIPTSDETLVEALDATGASYVLLITGRRGFLPRKKVEPARVAEAVSAADDLSGEPRLVVDLTADEEWVKLGGHT